MDDGELLPDDVMIGIVDERLAKDDTSTRGYILDGFPRTVAQAEALVKITSERPIDVVIDLDVPAGCGAAAAGRPAHLPGLRHHLHRDRDGSGSPWICDVCGGDVVQRTDDTEEAINRRLDLYESPDLAADRVLRRPSACSRWSTASAARTRCSTAGEGRRGPPLRPASPGPVRALRAGPPHGGRAGRDAPRPAGSWPRCTSAIRCRHPPRGHDGRRSTPSAARCSSAAGRASNFLGYHGYPAVICASVNDDGDPRHPAATQVLEEGDLVSIDCGAIVDGWHGDAAFTAGGGHDRADGRSG